MLKRYTGYPLHFMVVTIGVLILLMAGPTASVPQVHATGVLHVPSAANPTIQSAIDDASTGDIIQVAQGTYTENIVINGDDSGIRLRGRNAVLQGAGAGIGIHLLSTTDVEVQGFVVDGYELGILLEGTSHSRVHNVETRNNDSDTASLRDGLALWDSHNNHITNVYAHHNGHNGITFRNASTGNTVHGNKANLNGQNPAVATNFGGCGVQLIAGGHNDNVITANETVGNGWGIQIGGGSADNTIAQNRSHQNARAGVVMLDSASGNFIGQNNAKGNGLANVGPSFAYDLFDQGELNKTWRNNQGSFNH